MSLKITLPKLLPHLTGDNELSTFVLVGNHDVNQTRPNSSHDIISGNLPNSDTCTYCTQLLMGQINHMKCRASLCYCTIHQTQKNDPGNFLQQYKNCFSVSTDTWGEDKMATILQTTFQMHFLQRFFFFFFNFTQFTTKGSIDNISAMVQLMATSKYLVQCLPRSKMPYGVTNHKATMSYSCILENCYWSLCKKHKFFIEIEYIPSFSYEHTASACEDSFISHDPTSLNDLLLPPKIGANINSFSQHVNPSGLGHMIFMRWFNNLQFTSIHPWMDITISSTGVDITACPHARGRYILQGT